MISVLAFNFGDMSSNPAEAYIFLQNLCLKRTKINKKRPGFAKLKKWLLVTVLICRSDGQTVLDANWCQLGYRIKIYIPSSSPPFGVVGGASLGGSTTFFRLTYR